MIRISVYKLFIIFFQLVGLFLLNIGTKISLIPSAVINNPESEIIQEDGRIRRWASIEEMQGKYLRVILLEDAETIHNAFFDRGHKP